MGVVAYLQHILLEHFENKTPNGREITLNNVMYYYPSQRLRDHTTKSVGDKLESGLM